MNTEFGRKAMNTRDLKNTLQAGARLQNGKYVILEVYGQGPFTISYLARQTVLGKKAIINEFFLMDHCSRESNGSVINEKIEEKIYATFCEKWFEEAILLSKCSGNEHFVTVLDAFEENNSAYYVTEYINEEDLRTFTLAQKNRCLDEANAVRMISQICNGLSFLHEHKIYHLNLSPIKVLVDKNERAVIFSVGIARNLIPSEIVPDFTILTKAGYSAPELYHRESEGGALTDIYSVGAILYFLLTGQDPASATDRFTKPLIEPRNLVTSVSPTLNAVVMKAMAMEPENRYQNLADLVKDLPEKKPVATGLSTKKVILFATLSMVAIALMTLVITGLITHKRPIKQIAEIINQKKANHLDKLAKLSLNEDKTRGMTLLKDAESHDSLVLGNYFALLIGIENYKDSRYQKLSKPVSDAMAMFDVLTTCYTFERNRVTLLKDPDKKEIFRVLNLYRDNLGINDNLFIFYAGHGRYDEKTNTGYLIPSDADYKNDADWISFPDIRKKFEAISARHILLIADACFAGSVFRGGESDVEDEIDQMTLEQLSKKSRTAFTSAFLKPVPDKSEFLQQLIGNLKSNRSRVLLSEDLYITTRNSLLRSTSKKDPVKWGVLQDCGDEGGDFILIRRSH
jgi:serine/threonine protein kinase